MHKHVNNQQSRHVAAAYTIITANLCCPSSGRRKWSLCPASSQAVLLLIHASSSSSREGSVSAHLGPELISHGPQVGFGAPQHDFRYGHPSPCRAALPLSPRCPPRLPRPPSRPCDRLRVIAICRLAAARSSSSSPTLQMRRRFITLRSRAHIAFLL